MRFESTRLAVEQFGVEKRKNVRADLRKTAAIVGKVFAFGIREASLLINEITNSCKMSR